MSVKQKFLRLTKDTFRLMGVDVSWHRKLPPKKEIVIQPRNCGVDVKEFRDSLIHHLCSHGCWIRTIFSENEEVQKICFKYSDRAVFFKAAESFRVGDVSLKLDPIASQHPHRKLRFFHFTNGSEILGADNYAFDPWLGDTERVYSHSENNLVSSVPAMFQERTPLAVGPYFLQGDDRFDVDYQSSLKIPESADNTVKFPIDIVITWVNGNDKSWRQKYNEAKRITTGLHADSISEARFRSRDELRFCLRSVHYFAKFARNIFLVTDDQVPSWLETADKRVTVVSHRDIFPKSSDLPVFNSHAIEANLHRIKGLSENFIYLNDDVFLWSKCRPVDFFDYSGGANVQFEPLPNVYGDSLASVPAWRTAAVNVNKLLIERFGTTIYKPHLHIPFSMKRSVMERIWTEFPDVMERVSASRFRSHLDVSPASFFHPVFAYLTGAARMGSAKSIRTGLGRNDFQRTLENALHDTKLKFICINDDDGPVAIKNENVYRTIIKQKFSSPAPWEKDQ